MKTIPILLLLALSAFGQSQVHSFRHKDNTEHERLTNLGETNINGQTFIFYLHEWPVGTNRITGKMDWIQRVHLSKKTDWPRMVSSRTNQSVSAHQSQTNVPVELFKKALSHRELEYAVTNRPRLEK